MKKRPAAGREINLHVVDSKRVKSFLPLPIEPLIVENIFGFLNICSQCNFVATCSLVFKIVNSDDFPTCHLWKIAMFLKQGMKLESEWERRNFYLGVVYRLEGEIQSIKNDCQPNQKYECFHLFNTNLASYKSIVVSIQGLNQSNIKITIVEASFQYLFSSEVVSIFSVLHESKTLVHLNIGAVEQLLFKDDLYQLIDRDTFRNCILSHASTKHKQAIEEYESGVLFNLLNEIERFDWATTRTAQEGIATGAILIEMLSNRDQSNNNLQTLISIKHLAQHYTMTNFSAPMTLTLPFYKKIIHSTPLQYYKIKLGFESYIKVTLTVTFSGSIEDGQDTFYLRYEANEAYVFTDVSLVLGFENVNKIVPLFYWSRDQVISTHNEWKNGAEHYLMKIQELLELKKVPTPCSLVDIMFNYARTRRVDNLLHELSPNTESSSGLSKLPLKSITNGIEKVTVFEK